MTTRTYKKYLPVIAIAVLAVAAACSSKKDSDEQPASGREDSGFGAIPPNAWVTNPPNKPAW
jgi:uncharacterized lipoprotein